MDKVAFVQSPNLVRRKVKDGMLAYNSLFGCPMVLNPSGYQLLRVFKRPRTLAEIGKSFEIEDLSRWADILSKNHLIVPQGFDERAQVSKMVARGIKRIASGKNMVSLGLILDEHCNFDCTYCLSKKMIQASKRTTPEGMTMPWPTAKASVDYFMTYLTSLSHDKAEIYFGGSEPLLSFDLMEKIVDYSLSTYGHKFEFTFSTNTNLALVDEDIARFLAEHQFMTTTSLDGPREVNDQVRILVSGGGTYNQIMRGWDSFTRNYQTIEWFCLTLTDGNIDGIDEGFFDFMAKRGIKSCSFEPDIITSLSKDPKEVIGKLLAFKKMGKERDITIGGMWDKPTKYLFEPNIYNRMFDCSAFTGRGISVSPLGDILPCSYSGTKLGHISEIGKLLTSERFQTFVSSRAIGNIPACVGCEIEGQCIGGCLITQEYGECIGSDEAFEYRCDIYKGVTRALVDNTLHA